LANKTSVDGLRVLVVDDEEDIRRGLEKLIRGTGAEVYGAADGAEGLAIIERGNIDLVLTDLMMPRMSGADLLAEVKERFPEIEVLILTGFGTIQSAVSCLQKGAAHFMTKPFNNQEVLQLVTRVGRCVMVRRGAESGETPDVSGVIAQDPAMQRVMQLVGRVAKSPVPVLIEGESGTGKEVVARTIHARSSVAERPFLAVNAAALPDTLLESELFGHTRGSFTGADRDREGIFRDAKGGTVFLDEVGSMSPTFQGKLLRVLQEKTVRPLGASRDIPVEFRLISASNRDLESMFPSGEFREDLFYRLGVVRVHLPRLKDRPGDIVPLAMRFLKQASATCLGPDAAPIDLSASTLETLQHHPWPGNVRELENAMHRAVIVCQGDKILPHHLGLTDSAWAELETETEEEQYAEGKQRAIERFQREFVQRSLEAAQGNVSHAAERCGLTRAAFQRIMRQLGIDREAYR